METNDKFHSSTSLPLDKKSPFSSNRRSGWSRGRYGEEIDFLCPVDNRTPDGQACIIVTILDALSQILWIEEQKAKFLPSPCYGGAFRCVMSSEMHRMHIHSRALFAT